MRVTLSMTLAFAALVVAGCGHLPRIREARALSSFRNETQLSLYLQALDEQQRRDEFEVLRKRGAGDVSPIEVRNLRRRRRPDRRDPDSTIAVSVVGRVLTREGQPIQGVSVQLGGSDGVPLPNTSTDASGRFALPISRAALAERRAMSLTTRRIGFRDGARAMTVRAGDSIIVSAVLDPMPNQLSISTGPSASDPIAALPTNVQEAGVDEGGLVKRTSSDGFLILRRGRLISVSARGDSLRLIGALSLPRSADESSDRWYDELLVTGDRAVVIGFDYNVLATIVLVYAIDADGRMTPRATYQIKSGDYYSSRDYSSRIIDGKVLLYATGTIMRRQYGAIDGLPALRIDARNAAASLRSLVPLHRVFRLPGLLLGGNDAAVHSIITFDPHASEPEFKVTSVISGPGATMFVSPRASYLWTGGGRRDSTQKVATFVVKLSHGDSVPSAVRATGAPVDQFSFLEDPDGVLHTLLRRDAVGAGFWYAEETSGPTSLIRIPARAFGNAQRPAPQRWYRQLASEAPPAGETFVNRFVGRSVLYGNGNGLGRPNATSATLHIVPIDGGQAFAQRMPHGIDRIEVIGRRALVAGSSATSMTFSMLNLSGAPAVAAEFRVANLAQAETRSHAFFYNASDSTTGMIAMPVRGSAKATARQLLSPAESMMYIDWRGNHFMPVGSLEPLNPEATQDVNCDISCADWYGNSRPLFLGGRLFALLGDEIVEGRLEGGRVRERRRLPLTRPDTSR